MAVTSSGQITIQDIMTELGVSGESALNDADFRALIAKDAAVQMAISEWYGASAETVLTGNNLEIKTSDYISAGGTLRLSSGAYIYSDDTAVAGLIIDTANCFVINEGYIMGRGGDAYNAVASSAAGVDTIGGAGGPAINVTASGVTITNSSGAYIGGGGGAGGSGWGGLGGGGAGGGQGGTDWFGTTLYGGAPGQKGDTYDITRNRNWAVGGGSEGGGGGAHEIYQYSKSTSYQRYSAGNGGGRIFGSTLINIGHDGKYRTGTGAYRNSDGGDGGSAFQNVLPNAQTQLSEWGSPNVWENGGGGGGGWGQAGGAGDVANAGVSGAGGAAGAAITGTSRTLSNSGTIYGAT
jgi:hypothetical protein